MVAPQARSTTLKIETSTGFDTHAQLDRSKKEATS
jgi:hypothetical protein